MTDACTMLRDISEPKYGERTKVLSARCAKLTGLGFFRVKAIWYGYERRIEYDEYQKIKAAHIKWQMMKVKHVQHELEAFLSGLQASLSRIDESFHSPTIDALGAARRQ